MAKSASKKSKSGHKKSGAKKSGRKLGPYAKFVKANFHKVRKSVLKGKKAPSGKAVIKLNAKVFTALAKKYRAKHA